VPSVSGAVPADPAQYLQLRNVVKTLAMGAGVPTPAIYVINDPFRFVRHLSVNGHYRRLPRPGRRRGID
jgi:hypothetical protein